MIRTPNVSTETESPASTEGLRSLSYAGIGCAYRVHGELGPGFLESVYENALAIELGAAGLRVSRQVPLTVHYRGTPVGQYVADMVVDERLILEIKAVRTIAPEHEVQLVHYLTATGMDHGLLINFGPSVQVKHKYRQPSQMQPAPDRRNT